MDSLHVRLPPAAQDGLSSTAWETLIFVGRGGVGGGGLNFFYSCGLAEDLIALIFPAFCLACFLLQRAVLVAL